MFGPLEFARFQFLVVIEQHETDILQCVGLEIIFELGPPGSRIASDRLKIKLGGGALTPEVQARRAKPGVSMEP
jgi:hypothetical protein